MANVRMSGKVIEAINGKCAEMRNAAVNALPSVNNVINPGDPLYAGAVDLYLDAQWGAYRHLIPQMPTKWLTQPQRVDFHLGACICYVNVDGDTRVFNRPGLGDRMPDVYVRDNDQRALALFAHILEREAQIKEIRARYDHIAKQLINFVSSFSSLNAALKAMPELELYMTKELMDKVNEPVVRTKKGDTVPAVAVDLESVVSLAVAHQINSSVR